MPEDVGRDVDSTTTSIERSLVTQDVRLQSDRRSEGLEPLPVGRRRRGEGGREVLPEGDRARETALAGDAVDGPVGVLEESARAVETAGEDPPRGRGAGDLEEAPVEVAAAHAGVPCKRLDAEVRLEVGQRP